MTPYETLVRNLKPGIPGTLEWTDTRLDLSTSFRKTHASMRVRSLPLALRWAALLQAILLLPPTLVGSICLRDGKAATLELGICPCLHAPARSATPTISQPGSPECGPCQDLTITALAGSRVITPAMQPAGDIQSHYDHPEMGQPTLCPIAPRHSGDPPGRLLAVLRC